MHGKKCEMCDSVSTPPPVPENGKVCNYCGGDGHLADPNRFGEPDGNTLRQCEHCNGTGQATNPQTENGKRENLARVEESKAAASWKLLIGNFLWKVFIHEEDALLWKSNFNTAANAWASSEIKKAVNAKLEGLARELERFRDVGKLKSGDDIADTITKYVNDPRCSSCQAEKRRLLTDLEAEITGMFTTIVESIRNSLEG